MTLPGCSKGFEWKEIQRAFVRLPLTPASVTLLTQEGPYADAIAYGQTKVGNGVLDVSIVGELRVQRYAKERGRHRRQWAAAAPTCAAPRSTSPSAIWSDRRRFVKRLTSMEEAIQRHQNGWIWSGCWRQPRGGGTGQTTTLLKKLYEAKAQGRALRSFSSPSAAAARGRKEIQAKFSEGFSAPANVLKTTDGNCVGRRGIWAGRALELGPTCALQIGGVTVVCVSRRKQCADPVFFEMHGLDIVAARTVVVSRAGTSAAVSTSSFRRSA